MPLDFLAGSILAGIFEAALERPQFVLAGACAALAICLYSFFGAPLGWLGGIPLAGLAAASGWRIGAVVDDRLGSRLWSRLGVCLAGFVLTLVLIVAAIAFAAR